MEEIKLTIIKPYARQVIEDLEKMEAISIEKKSRPDVASLAGSWRKQSIEEIDAEIQKLRNEWERDFS